MSLKHTLGIASYIKAIHYRQKHFFHASVNFKILGFLAFHIVLFQTSGVTVTRWSALESHQRALHTRKVRFTHNYISQNSLPGLISTDHIHLYLIH